MFYEVTHFYNIIFLWKNHRWHPTSGSNVPVRFGYTLLNSGQVIILKKIIFSKVQDAADATVRKFNQFVPLIW